MNPQRDEAGIAARRAGARRTALIVGAIALAIFVAFFVKQGIWH